MKPFASHSAISGVNPARGSSGPPVKLGDASETISFTDDQVAVLEHTLASWFDIGIDPNNMANSQHLLGDSHICTGEGIAGKLVLTFSEDVGLSESDTIFVRKVADDTLHEFGIVTLVELGGLVVHTSIDSDDLPFTAYAYYNQVVYTGAAVRVHCIGPALGDIVAYGYGTNPYIGLQLNGVFSEVYPGLSTAEDGNKEMRIYTRSGPGFDNIGVEGKYTITILLRSTPSKSSGPILGNGTGTDQITMNESGSDTDVTVDANYTTGAGTINIATTENLYLVTIVFDLENIGSEMTFYLYGQDPVTVSVPTTLFPINLDRLLYSNVSGLLPPAWQIYAIYANTAVAHTEATVDDINQWFIDNGRIPD